MNIKELYWAAGFLEGEGSFSLRSRHYVRGGRSISIKASQVNPEPLYRLKALFGGSIYGPYMNRVSIRIKKQQPFMEWHLGGQKAAEVYMTLYSLMSSKRQNAIRHGLEMWKLVPLSGKAKRVCNNGHAFTEENTKCDTRGHRYCRLCRQEVDRRANAKRRPKAQEQSLMVH